MAHLPSPSRGTWLLTLLVGLGSGCGDGELPGFSALGGSSSGGDAGSSAHEKTSKGGSAGLAGSTGDTSGGKTSPASGGEGAEAAEGGEGAKGSGAQGGTGAKGGTGSEGGSASKGGTGGEPPEDCTLATFAGHGYAFCGVVASAEAARVLCDALGMTQVSIESAEENAFVASSSPSDCWLGGSDREEQQHWTWLGSGVVFWDDGPVAGAYSRFLAGNPNNNGPEQTNEDCLALFKESDGQWNDLSCDFAYYRAVCESATP
jgi:hypothetical protein